MSLLAVRGPTRPHVRSKSSTRTNRSDEQSDRDSGLARRSSRRQANDVNDDAATLSFVRRVLCAGHLKPGNDSEGAQSLEGLLPPLTSSNDIDLQIYAIIAVIIKDFVQTWYSKITPDHEFVDHVIHIIAHCTRGLEQRLRRVDLESLYFDEIPALLNKHADTFRTAKAATNAPTGNALGCDARTIYHSINRHSALSPVPQGDSSPATSEQRANEQVWRQLLIEGVLDNLLPPEDLQNPCLKAMVSEIFSEMIIGNVLGGKVCQGWFLWDVTTKVILAVRPPAPIQPALDGTGAKKSNRLDQFGLLPEQTAERVQTRPRRRFKSVYALIINAGWELLRLIVLVVTTLRTAIAHFSEAASLPSRLEAVQDTGSASSEVSENGDQKAAVLDMSALKTPTHLLNLDFTMPWLSGLASLVQHYAIYGPWRTGGVDSRLDRLLSSHLSNITSPRHLPTLLKVVRASLFPNNSLAAGAPPPSTAAEIAAVRQRCAQSLLSLVPPAAKTMYFGTSDEASQIQSVEDNILALFEDEYLNKHLLFAVVEVVICRIFPELVDQSGEAARS